MPEELGGGQAGVDSAHAHPNREPVIFWFTVDLFLFVVVLIIYIQTINCYFCNSKSTAAPPTKSRRKHLVCRIIFITLLAIELLLVAASVFLLVVYFCSMDLVVSYLKAQPQTSPELTHIPTSLPDGLHAVMAHTSSFIYEGIQSGRMHTISTVKTFVSQTRVGKNESTLMAEVEKQYDAAVVSLKEFVEVDGNRIFARLTQKLPPCSEAHVAYTVATEVTCGESGVVKRLFGLVYVLALSVVFLVLLYLSILKPANFHTLQVCFPVGEAASAGGDDGENSTTTSSCNDEKLS
ncbi:hypothetical protein EmuJ_001115300 [Echinococcus multilocularis]|uniref:Uncharacterized protein n=1 Tax=Echinococcus multilocularis TaxID=6211 RepID=A0A068YFP3_ECHMU|nr:hypothetical protein EmuJ_001115300 [Echinococcus multilocularis]